MQKAASREVLWLGSLVLLVCAFWIPVLNVQPYLSPGDMGRDLYAFQETLRGHWPCRDYWWQYGPLMLLYYAFWFLVGGVNMVSVRVGLGVLYLLSSLLTYRTLRLFTSPAIAFLSSLAFLSLNMTWTFNHVGAFPFLILSIFSLWKFFLTHQTRWCYLGLLCLVFVASIKINTGLTSFSALYASLLLFCGFFQWKHFETPLDRKHFVFLPLIFSILVFATYAFVYRGVSLDWIDQCLTIAPKYRTWAYSPWTNFKHLILRFVVWQRSRLFWVGAFLAFGVLGNFGLRKRRLLEGEKEVLLAIMGSLFLFGLANSIEYFTTEGMIYRFDFWFFPVFVLWMGLFAEGASFLFGRRAKKFLGGLIFLLLLLIPFQNLKQAYAWRTPERYLNSPEGRVYVGSPPSLAQVLNEGTDFIIRHTKPSQEILAIPYDPLYCFLSNRRHAVRELMFMENNLIKEKQEEEIIQQLEVKQVPLIIFTNRYRSIEGGVGYFGKTHCQKLARYVFDRYEEVRTFGPWKVDSGFHAIKVLRRKS